MRFGLKCLFVILYIFNYNCIALLWWVQIVSNYKELTRGVNANSNLKRNQLSFWKVIFSKAQLTEAYLIKPHRENQLPGFYIMTTLAFNVRQLIEFLNGSFAWKFLTGSIGFQQINHINILGSLHQALSGEACYRKGTHPQIRKSI